MDLCHIAAQVGETMKNFTRPKYARIRQILEMIREGTRAGRYPNATDFRNRLGIPRRTLMRDLDFLRDDEGAPIEYDASRKGYRLTAETWSLPAMQLSRKEVFAFSVASRLLERFEGTPLELDVRSVLGKIADSMQGSITVDVGNMTERYSVLGEDHVVQDPEVWAAAPDYVDARFSLANALAYGGKFDAAVAEYRKVVEARPDFAQAYGSLGVVLASRPDTVEESLVCHRAAVGLLPNDAVLQCNFGLALAVAGRTNEAKQAFAAALALSPGYAPAAEGLRSMSQ
jgi:tetratricopeptide (TPR) repeat protein